MPKVSLDATGSLELLESLSKGQQPPTNLIICSTREEFLNQLLLQVEDRQESVQDDSACRDDIAQTAVPTLLVPTLALLSACNNINLVYCSSLPVLRAYLSSYASTQLSLKNYQLIILDLIALHHATSEYNLQGLSRTLATAASAAHQVNAEVTLVECMDIADPANPHRGLRLWGAEVPLLSGSIKIGQEGARWAGNAMCIRKIASRWFTFPDAAHASQAQISAKRSDQDEDMIT